MMRVLSPTVFLIANHPQIVYLIERYGEQSGCRIRSVDSVDNAMKLMQQDRPTMVLQHLMPQPHDGWATLRHLQGQPVMQNISVTIIAAEVDEARARSEGAAYWLWQPVMYSDFQAALVATGVLPPPAALRKTSAHGDTDSR